MKRTNQRTFQVAVCQGLLSCWRHIRKREDPGHEVYCLRRFFWLPGTYHFTEQNFESDSDYGDNDIVDEGLSFKILSLKNRTRQQSVNYTMKTKRCPHMFIKKLSTVRLRRNNILKWVNISTACFFCYLSKLSAHKVTV